MLVLCCPLRLVGAAHAQIRRPKADVTPLVEQRRACTPGEPARVALQVSLPEGSTPSRTSRAIRPDSDRADRSTRRPASRSTEIVFPPSTDLKQAGQDQPLAVFERTFAIGVQLDVAASVPAGTIVVPAHLRYQACDENLCYAPSTRDGAVDARRRAARRGADSRRDRDVFGTIAFGNGEAPARGAGGRGAAAPAGAGRRAGDGIAQLDDFTVLGTTGGYLERRRVPHASSTTPRTASKERGMFEGRGPLAILLIVLLGGLALNLTPCVLPMIPINLAIIGAGAQAGSRGRGFLLGAAYGAAMALVYGVLGLVVILTAGTFGTINSSPWFNLGIAVLFVVLGSRCSTCSMIDFSTLLERLRRRRSSRGIVRARLHMGAVAALLAGACVAPVVIQVVLFSSNLYATGTTLALALPFCLGLGMAIPWPIAGAGLAALPKPGAWMVRVKQAFGVFILGDGGLLRLRGVRDLREPLGRSGGGRVERRGAAEGRLARVARRRPRRRAARAEAGADRHVGDVVQELPHDGQDDAGERRRCRRRSRAT